MSPRAGSLRYCGKLGSNPDPGKCGYLEARTQIPVAQLTGLSTAKERLPYTSTGSFAILTLPLL